MDKTVVKDIITLIVENGEHLAEDLVILRMMGFEKEVFAALFSCYQARMIELNIAVVYINVDCSDFDIVFIEHIVDILEKIYYEK